MVEENMLGPDSIKALIIIQQYIIIINVSTEHALCVTKLRSQNQSDSQAMTSS